MRSRIYRIRERSALIRQVQQFFHMHLLGVFSWDEAQHQQPIRVSRQVDFTKRREVREAERDDRTFHDIVGLNIGPFEIIVKGPYEDEKHPCGLIHVSLAAEMIEGPLDEATWERVGKFIKQRKEERDGPTHRSPAADPSGRPDADPAEDLRARAPWGR